MNKMKLDSENTLSFGIDLGTTNSCISLVKANDIPEIIKLDTGKTTFPSCVMWLGGDKFVAGSVAYENRHKSNVAYSAKRLMGSDEIITLEYKGEKRDFTPSEISAQVLIGLVDSVKSKYPVVKDVVITVPAYFNNRQVEDTAKAAELAGLNLLSTFREPTSAGLLYGLNMEDNNKTIAVYDLGGGTFDVSILDVMNVKSDKMLDDLYGFKGIKDTLSLDVIEKTGDMLLGGDNIDKNLIDIVLAKGERKGLDLSRLTKESYEYVKLKLEKYKKDLGGGYRLNWTLEYTDGEKIDLELELNSNDLFEATRPVYERTKRLLDEALKNSKRKNIDRIILVGGSTKSEYIRSRLSSDYPNSHIDKLLNADESVALGAGLQAKLLKHGSEDIKINDILPLAIGVDVSGRIEKILVKNQSIPHTAIKWFSTSYDNQKYVKFRVYQGNSNVTERNTYLGDLVIDNIPDGEAGKPDIGFSLSVDITGVLKCKVYMDDVIKETTLVNVLKGNIKGDSLSKDDLRIEKWLKVAEKKMNDSELEQFKISLDKYKKGELRASAILSLLK